MLLESRELPVNLVLLDFMEFDVILRMNWLSQHYTVVYCRSKEVIFRILDEEEFKFVGDKSFAPHNLIFTITGRKMLRKSCQGYLAVVRDTSMEKISILDVLVVCEFPDVFPEELPGLPPHKEI